MKSTSVEAFFLFPTWSADAGSWPTSTVASPGASCPSATQSATSRLTSARTSWAIALPSMSRAAMPRRLDGGPADTSPGARQRVDHRARGLRVPAAGRGRRQHVAPRRIAQREHGDVALARGVELGEAGDERDRQARGDHPARRERVVALERDPRLEAGLAAE